MTAIPVLGDIVPLSADSFITAWGVTLALESRPLNALGDFAGDAFTTALDHLGRARIHPTALISPLAKVGPDVVIGPDCTIHEFATVRGHSVLSAGVQIGFGCEVTNAVIAQGTRLAHKICLGYSIVGQGVHLSASLVVASTHLWNADMGHPDREVTIHLPGGALCRTGLIKLGAIIGDRCRIGAQVTLGPGLIIGADTVIYPHTVAAGEVLPPRHVLRLKHAVLAQEPRRDLPLPAQAIGQPYPVGDPR